MKKSFVYAAGVSMLLAGAPFAVQAQSQAGASDRNQGQSTTVTGCVTAGADGRSYTLTESGNGSMATSAKTWMLMSTGAVDLSKYVNHKVEITGTSDNRGGVSDTTPSATQPATPPAAEPGQQPPSTQPPSTQPSAQPPSSTSGAGAAAGVGPQFHVTSVRDISDTCS